ncbi:MAG: hypothetical protein NTW86_30620 [Candidatus Sumerlaeota bacterium]|nr:hypothetical protein [Candidatus Sumerlaeota bacterium]
MCFAGPARVALGSLAGAMAGLCLMGPLCFAQPEPVFAGRAVVLVLYSFPTKASREFCEELQRACQAAATDEPLQVSSIGAMGDLAALSERLAAGADGERPLAIVCLDAAVARCARPCPCPKIVITQSREMLPSSPERLDRDSSDTCVLETLPRGPTVLKALCELEPAPRSLGIVRTQEAPGAERFMGEFLDAWKGSSLRQAAVRQCVLDPGGCRNAAEVKQALDEDFADLAQGDLLLAVPDTNTLKFAYAIRRFAQAKQVGFISLGEFGAEGALLWVHCPAQRLASICAAILVKQRSQPGASTAQDPPDIVPEARFDEATLQELGFARRPPARPAPSPQRISSFISASVPPPSVPRTHSSGK